LTRPEEASSSGQSSLSLSLPYRVPLCRHRRHQSLLFRRPPPLRFRPLRRLPGDWQLPLPGEPSPSTCPLSVSHALRALLRQTPAGLVSCRSRPWGCTLQGRNPPAEPHLLSEAVALLRLTDRAATIPTAAALSSSWEGLETTVAPDDGATHDQLHFRALLPASVCTSEPVV
jgi:hypothetical protein